MTLSLDDVDPSWKAALEPVTDRLASLTAFLATEQADGRDHLPPTGKVLRAFSQPLESVRVLIVGQDPYPTPGHAVGLSFSVAPEVRLPGSLRNIFKEYCADLGYPKPATGDLTPWTERGVLLLNRVLTVEPRNAGAHRRKGWEQVTDAAIRALVARGTPLVSILWGRDAQSLQPLLGDTPAVLGVHPSPMSANNGFFGSRPFSRANELLAEQGAEPVDWRLP